MSCNNNTQLGMAVFSNFGTGNHTSLWPFTIIDYWCGAVFIILGKNNYLKMANI